PEGRVVVDPPGVIEHAAVAVVGELVQAQVGHDHRRVAELRAQPGEGPVEDPLRIGGAGADGVLVLGHAEEHHAAHAALHRLGRGAGQGVQSVLLDAGHRGDGAVLRRALAHEHRQHEIRRARRVLAHPGPHRGARARPAPAIDGGGEGREGQRNSCGRREREVGAARGGIGRAGARGNGGGGEAAAGVRWGRGGAGGDAEHLGGGGTDGREAGGGERGGGGAGQRGGGGKVGGGGKREDGARERGGLVRGAASGLRAGAGR